MEIETKFRKSLFLISSLVLLLLLNGCTNTKKPEKSNQQEKIELKKSQKVEDNEFSKPQKKLSKPDLVISNVRLEKAKGAQAKYFSHIISVDVVNNGEQPAKGFDCTVKYNCPGGLVLSAGDDIQQGGYLGPKQKRKLSRSIKIKCEPIPAILDIELNADYNNDVAESNESNNILRVRVNVPF